MNEKNTIYASVALLILIAATGLAVWYAYLTKQSVDGSRPKSFNPLVVTGSGSGTGTEPFNNDEITEKTFDEKTKTGGSDGTTTETSGETNTPGLNDDGTKPDGQSGSDTKTDTKTGTQKKQIELFKLYEGPVAGYTTYQTEKKEEVARIAERQRGNIIDVPLGSKKVERVTNSTILGVHRAVFAKGGQHVLLQHLESDDSLLTLSTPVSELAEKKDDGQAGAVGTYLPVNIQSLIVRDDTVLFAAPQEDGSLSLATTNLSGEKIKRIWKSPIRGWNIAWSGEGIVSLLVNQKPALGIPGYAYRISVTKNSVEKIFGDEPGLVTLESPRGSFILKTIGDSTGYTSEIVSKTGNKIALKKAVFPEKCTWSNNEAVLMCGIPVDMQGNSYPDLWMQGARIYADTLTRIDPRTGIESVVIETVKGSKNGLDVTEGHYTDSGNFFLFIDKTTATLWGVSLE